MKITFVNGIFPQLSQTFVIDQIDHAIRAGHEVEVVCSRRNANARHHKLERSHIYDLLRPARIKRDRTRRIRQAKGAVRCVAPLAPRLQDASTNWQQELTVAGSLRGAPDVFLVNFGSQLPLAVNLKRRFFPGAKIACIFHGFDVSTYPEEHGWSMYQSARGDLDLGLTVNGVFAERLRQHVDFREVEVFHLGVDLTQLPPRHRGTDDAFSVLLVGRAVEKKGLRYLIHAVDHLRDLNLRVHVIGEGPLLNAAIEQARNLGVEDRVVFYGARPHEFVLEIIARTDCFVLPSVTADDGDMEGIPVVLMEAMGIGVPVVTTRHSGIPELVENEKHGLVVPERDAEALAGAIRRVAEGAGDFTSAARQRVETEFNMATQYQKLWNRLAQVVGS